MPPGSPLAEWVRKMLACAETNSVCVHLFRFLADIALLMWAILGLFPCSASSSRCKLRGSLDPCLFHFRALESTVFHRYQFFQNVLQHQHLRAGSLQVQYLQVLASFRSSTLQHQHLQAGRLQVQCLQVLAGPGAPPGASQLQDQGHLQELAAFRRTEGESSPRSGTLVWYDPEN